VVIREVAIWLLELLLRLQKSNASGPHGSNIATYSVLINIGSLRQSGERLTRRQKELLKEFAALKAQEFNVEKRRKKGRLVSKKKE
jgi:hypothetical protein